MIFLRECVLLNIVILFLPSRQVEHFFIDIKKVGE